MYRKCMEMVIWVILNFIFFWSEMICLIDLLVFKFVCWYIFIILFIYNKLVLSKIIDSWLRMLVVFKF